MAGRKTVRDKQSGEVKLAVRKSPARKDIVFRRLEQSVPRNEWLQAFEASGDERAEHLMVRMLDPAFASCSLPQHAKAVGLTYPQVFKLITNHRLNQGLLRMSAHVPQVLEDVAVDSESKLVPCPMCQGGKVLFHTDKETGDVIEKPCWSCDGQGKLRKVGDEASRKLMFETLQLTGRKGPLIAQQFVNAGGQTVEDALDTVSQALDITPKVLS